MATRREYETIWPTMTNAHSDIRERCSARLMGPRLALWETSEEEGPGRRWVATRKAAEMGRALAPIKRGMRRAGTSGRQPGEGGGHWE